ncbi:MAG: 16S rRNA (cytidine(1402)-2'-O)-methyltransferase [Gammaproteobacteria bacterium]|nr:16S rRNA (cytidine(1402)-2'-O)-methyltransferase [Gammaproteobacteria bacterium]MDE0442195.1 16S rRNA (cytidine(1402)-2'-O)-methyltransferase [Gammaproteobacteria bacterium]
MDNDTPPAPPSRQARLYIVATPIGNLADITQRAVNVLKSVPVVACEDTRRSRVLLAHIGATPRRLVALHDHNEAPASAQIIEYLGSGQDVALITDAGTPTVSDPGFELVRLAWEAGITVTPVPGPSAVIAAVAASPIPVNRFRFEGFLPAKAAARREALGALLASDVAVVFFETPHRLRESLSDLVDLGGGDRSLLLCRELTKLHETLTVGTVADLLDSPTVMDRGEFACILTPASAPDESRSAPAVMDILAAELPPGQAARLAARITGASRGSLYERAIRAAAPARDP